MDFQAQKQMFDDCIKFEQKHLHYIQFKIFHYNKCSARTQISESFSNRFIYMHHLNELIHLNESHY